MYNPFKPIVETKYNINNIKKVYDIFPSSLRRAQLSSSELVELLRSQVFDRDITIEELRRQLAELSDFSNTTLDEQLANLGFDSISDLLNQFLEGGTEDAEEAALIAQGYKRISDTKLYVLVDDNAQSTYEFNINHTDENGKGIREADIKSPITLTFKNIGDTTVFFTKREAWLTDDDGFSKSNGNDALSRFDGNPFAYTNAFKFSEFTLLHERVAAIQPQETKTSQISLGYLSKNQYKEAGLKRGKANTWYGEMRLYASNDPAATLLNLRNTNPTIIGRMRLFRDIN